MSSWGFCIAVCVVLQAAVGYGQISKGQQILLNRGFQVQGLVSRDNGFQLSTYSNANYTSIMWLWDSNPSLMGAAPGFPWARWVNAETNMPPQGSEGPYMSQLVTLQLGDEWNLNDAALRTRAVNWFEAVRANFPNTILYMNNYGGQVGDAQLGDFITRARPDMIAFDTYPWRSDYTTRNPILGQPTSWYGDLRRYREHARQNNIPLGVYLQTFHAVQDYDQTVYRDPSPSELRLNHFGSLAFNAKVLIDFTYNTGASSLFTGGTDSNPTALFAEKRDAALRCLNFGKALVRLKPIGDAGGGYTTGIVFLRGRNSSGTPNPVPIGFLADPQTPTANTDWQFSRNDPYLSSWTVTNKPAIKNGGQPGDVLLSWFKLLDESFDGPNYTNEVYLMVVNALTDPTGTAADCLQEIRLNFTNGVAALDMLNPVTGQVQTTNLSVVGNQRQLVLNLNGGDAALFKFSDGASFAGLPVVGPPPVTAVSTGSVWKYLDNGSDQGSAWRGTNFNDSTWASGPAPLGYGDGDEATVVRSNRTDGTRIITTYFRRSFVLTEPSFFTNLTVRLLRDDGGIVYLNGSEVFRSNMPTNGPINFDTVASSTVPSTDETTNFYSWPVNPTLLVDGTNVISVEIHQANTNSTDISFDLELSGSGNQRPTALITYPLNGAILPTGGNVPLTVAALDGDGSVAKVEFFMGDTSLGQDVSGPFSMSWSNASEGLYTLTAIATDNGGKSATSAPVNFSLQSGLVLTGSAWKYLDDGSDQGTAWRGTNFNDNAWASGLAQLGYGDGDESTTVRSNRTDGTRIVTTYFRRRFLAPDPSVFTNLTLRLLRDDGAVVYLNSNEVFRSNMPGTPITYTSLASSNALPEDEAARFYPANVNPNRLVSGTNVIAVEVHQAATNSSDISFELELMGFRAVGPPRLNNWRAGTNALLSWPAYTTFRLESSPVLPAVSWSPVTNPVLTSNSQNIVTSQTTGRAGFFRLRQQ